MIAIIMILLKLVADQKAFRRAFVNIDAKCAFRGGGVIAGAFVLKCMRPVLLHALNAVLQNQFFGMALRILVDRFIPKLTDQSVASAFAQPFKSPFVMAAKVINS